MPGKRRIHPGPALALLSAAAALALAFCAGLSTARQAGLHLLTKQETILMGLELQWACRGRAMS